MASLSCSAVGSGSSSKENTHHLKLVNPGLTRFWCACERVFVWAHCLGVGMSHVTPDSHTRVPVAASCCCLACGYAQVQKGIPNRVCYRLLHNRTDNTCPPPLHTSSYPLLFHPLPQWPPHHRPGSRPDRSSGSGGPAVGGRSSLTATPTPAAGPWSCSQRRATPQSGSLPHC